MTMPYYASAEQIMRDRSDLARKGIARGRSVVAMTYADGVVLVAENPSKALHKVSELYDRLAFAAVGKYNEFENLRRAGIMHADMRGYSYDRRDVTGRSLANAYAQTLGSIFTDQPKPYEVEICVAEVAPPGSGVAPQLYRITYDGSIVDHSTFVVMGGAAEPVTRELSSTFAEGMDLATALDTAVGALERGTGEAGAAQARSLTAGVIEVGVLEHDRPRRAFRRVGADEIARLLPSRASGAGEASAGSGDAPAGGGGEAGQTPDPGPDGSAGHDPGGTDSTG
ncbi:proteasome subunit alpha [Tomitella fengzijianii]|uniref:Proteasome subunit alpha n=1 Tax=Tomitella fengzijianii TaxID=2597660 RepID=A0A516X2S1_9ACTN|nr:proteasome subunit alpha [Tomitella fengzijianii]QDQ97379.1 proteasome subunit alpha [Tomitella fengzijianii]